ncbi:hypothetical protein CR513_44234, partial [Mucuna pruriens]
MRAAEKREEELRQQIAALKTVEEQNQEECGEEVTPPFWGQPFCKEIDETIIPPNFREVVVEPFDGSQDPHTHLQAFQTQMYISGGNDRPNCKLFPGMLRGVAMQWMATLPSRSIQSFKDLVGSFLSQFAANKVKKLEVADLFDIKQGEGESLKKYLACFNNATVRVDDPDQKPHEQTQYFTPLNEKRTQIMHEICHTSLLDYPTETRGRVMGKERNSWCDIHKAFGHTTEDCWGLKTPIEGLVQSGHLDRYIQRSVPRRTQRQGRNSPHSAGTSQRDRSRSRQATPVHRGTISTISSGRTGYKESIPRASASMTDGRVQTILTGANAIPLGKRAKTLVITFDDSDMRGQAASQDEPMVISMGVAGYKVERVLINQGSSANILYRSTLKKMQLPSGLIQPCPGNLYGFAGECVPILGTVELETRLGERSVDRTIIIQYTIVDAPASYNIIVGRPALNRVGAIVSTRHLCMKFPVGGKVGCVWADTRTAQKCYEDSLRIERPPPSRIVNVLDLDLDPRSQFEREGPLPAEELKEVMLGPEQGQTIKIGTTMNPEEEEMLKAVLRSNYDVFAWSSQDMPGVDSEFICHRLSVDKNARPIAQKKRKMGEEKREAAKQEIRKLIAAGFVREVQYPTWLANVVMVRKANGKWRMCTDYTDLNKACPKDSYPLPGIDKLVDNVVGFTFLSFMDAYFGYNQIRMHPNDEEKTTFIIEEGAFCYQVMPFVLKNAGATYQHLMDKIFKEILGRDVEVYVDDMVARS